MKQLFILFAMITLTLGCQRSTKYQTLKYHQVEMPAAGTDISLPTKLWNLFESSPVPQKDGDKKQTEFMPLKVYLYERNHGILGGENHLLTYPSGGGELDLRDFVIDKNGSFYFAAAPVTKVESGHLRIYFLSNSVERQVGNDSFGNGCNNYFEITSAFKKAVDNEGFLLNTTAQRHISAIGGTFFFVIEAGDKLHISRLTVKDSRYPTLQCKR